jgi:heme/copper-type cytochrome/quinol oxidase subunit 4
MEKPRYKLSAIFGMIVLVIFVIGIAWIAFGGYSGSGPAASP